MAKGVKTGGRQKGTQNKATKELKEMILEALDRSGGVQYFIQQAESNPTAFMSLIGKVLPSTISASLAGSVNHNFNLSGLPWLTDKIQKRN